MVFVRRVRSLIALFLVFFFCVNLGAVGYIMVVHGEEYREAAARNQLYDETIDAVRGTIYDRNMTPLVTSTSAWILCANPNEIRKSFKNYDEHFLEDFYAYVSAGIAQIVSSKEEDVRALISREDSQYVRVKKEVTPTQKIALQSFLEEKYTFQVSVQSTSWGKRTTGNAFRRGISVQSQDNTSVRNSQITGIGACTARGDMAAPGNCFVPCGGTF